MKTQQVVANISQLSPFDDFIENGMVVQSMPDADFYLAKVAELDAQVDEVNESTELQIERIKLWQETRTSVIERQKEYFLKVLHGYLISTGKKTEKLVNGTLSLRKQLDEIVVEDKETVIKDGRFVKEKMTVSVDKTSIRKHIFETGEIPEGVSVNPREPRFSYKLNP
ncbi:MAG: host-nuclease inhibitor Gam family protein [Candidatus Marinimicrobia bacterium]|nr:host-nuclease inhibitor Gam family protein [Candidatus Brocadiales bacterium]MBL7046675.1 host-nuclease inhibitor Gam family protein [Candidatus Neomarinimicrobiota bacterium]